MQAYLDNIKAKTGKSPNDFRVIATEKGLVKHSEIIAWLKADFGLGHGHANAIAAVLKTPEFNKTSPDAKLEKVFTGSKAHWKKVFEALLEKIRVFAPEVELAPTDTYIGLLKNKKKFGIVQPSSKDRLDIGIKLKNAVATPRLELSGTWNAMVTHRVGITAITELDAELLNWLEQAYKAIQ
jgi:predicted transport protein